MDPITAMAIAGGVQSGGNFLQGHFNRKTQKRNVDKTIAANRELSQYAYQMDLEQWHRQNAYNSPESQMDRYKKAGLNPNLIYGQGTPGNATSSPDYKAPTEKYEYAPFQMPQMDLSQLIQQYQDVRLKSAQVDNVKAHTENVAADTAIKFLDKGLKSHELEVMRPYQAGILGNQAIASNKLPEQKEVELQRAQIARRLETMRLEWEKVGLSPQDKVWMRMVMKALPSMGISNQTVQKILGKQLYNQLTTEKDY